MKKLCLVGIFIVMFFNLSAQTLALHPKNPHIFTYKNHATLLIGSGEHYGAVMNLDFDYANYLKNTGKDGLNLTRLFTGPYKELAGAFGIQNNTMAPAGERYLCAWARSVVAGYQAGGNKFDLTKWDEAYFQRLKDFITKAQEQDIIVEICLFTSFYGAFWKASPFHPDNNINQTDDIPFQEVQTLKNGKYLQFQTEYVKKMVKELNNFDNFYFEIQNEPWADIKDTVFVRNDYLQKDDLKEAGNFWKATYEVCGKNSLEWQKKIAETIRETEKSLPKKHLISQNIANFELPLSEVNPQVDIFNFHYASSQAARLNYGLNKIIGFNETGFAGKQDHTYRRQAWRFIMSGGSLFNHLDYSFFVGKEDGTGVENVAPGGGSPSLRKQLDVLKKTLQSVDLVRLKPNPEIILKSGAFAYPVSIGQNEHLIYFECFGNFSVQLDLKNGGKYRIQWLDATTGNSIKQEEINTKAGVLSLNYQAKFTDIVLKINKL